MKLNLFLIVIMGTCIPKVSKALFKGHIPLLKLSLVRPAGNITHVTTLKISFYRVKRGMKELFHQHDPLLNIVQTLLTL